MKTLKEVDIITDSISNGDRVNKSLRRASNKLSTVALALTMGVSGVAFTSCSDGAGNGQNCSDFDGSVADGNGSSAYDTGTFADPYDFGGDTDVTSSGDPSGNGDNCTDSD